MSSSRRVPVVAGAIGGLALIAGAIAQSDQADPAILSAGAFTVMRADAEAYSEPASVLTFQQMQTFLRGRHHFQQNWVVFPSLGGDWGLGPTFVSDRCTGCHVKTGRGNVPSTPDEQLLSVLVRISIPGAGPGGAPRPHPVYGDQIQNRGLMGQDRDATFLGDRVPPEAELYVDWEARSVTLGDGEVIALRSPKLRIENPSFGPLGPEVMTSMRIAQPAFGLGLLEAVPEQTLRALAQAQRALGYNGRVNMVHDDINRRTAVGRFGWKANQPSIRQQIAAAFHGDLGVTSSVYDKENCPPAQVACAEQPPGNNPELIDQDWDRLEFWTIALAVPARRNLQDPLFKRGETLFAGAQCAVCHVPEMKTADTFPALKQLANQTFRAYTDLLLHDMGEELADGRPDFMAGPRDWRTQPLWGLGLSQTVNGSTAMLHDGRARNITEAILWHGGEAAAARDAFKALPKADREALVRFVESI
jgi:CxxC motif-containing protein (DUF1111 family)